MKFISIRQKLITRVSLIFISSFAIVLSLVAYMSSSQSSTTLKKSEQSVRSTLQDKGSLLVRNNSEALKGMVDDNDFSAVQDIVSNTVRNDIDLIYGIFVDVDMQPWVYAEPGNEDGTVEDKFHEK